MARAESWETIARALGARMANHVHCENEHVTIDEGLADSCAYCRDADAYRRFTAKAGQPIDPLAGMERINIEDVPMSPIA